MKKINLILVALLMIFISCDDDYKLYSDYTVPTELISPEAVKLDVESSEIIKFSWKGGGASDGSYVLYEVLFDKVGGDFSEPLHRMKSEYGTDAEISLSHAQLNTIARRAGIAPLAMGEVIWTVTTSKGGDVSPAGISQKITLERGFGIDIIPENLYLFGSATENGGSQGLKFRSIDEGVFVIYTQIGHGTLQLKNGTEASATNYFVQENKLIEGEGDFSIDSNDKVYRITVNFNTLGMRTELISNVRAIWGATFDPIGKLNYIGNGVFKADNCVIEFIDASRPHTNPPSWLSWVEDRYYFLAEVDGLDKCWGRMDDVSGENPVGGEPLSFYELGEFAWNQWDHLWKMAKTLDLKKATITINTNKENMKVHEFINVVPM